jgi:hypothetical protein
MSGSLSHLVGELQNEHGFRKILSELSLIINEPCSEIDNLEFQFVELNALTATMEVKLGKVETLEKLANVYHTGGYCRAAIECVRLLEPFLVKDLVALPRYYHEAGKLIVWNYLKIGANDEARRASKSTARIFACSKFPQQPDYAFPTYRYILESLFDLINVHEMEDTTNVLRVSRMVGLRTDDDAFDNRQRARAEVNEYETPLLEIA